MPAQAERAVRIAALAALACHEEGLPLVLRIVIPRVPGEPTDDRDRARAPRPRAWPATPAPTCSCCRSPRRSGAQGAWVCELAERAARRARAYELSTAADQGACGFALGRPLYEDGDAAWLLDAAVPLAAGLRALAEERASASWQPDYKRTSNAERGRTTTPVAIALTYATDRNELVEDLGAHSSRSAVALKKTAETRPVCPPNSAEPGRSARGPRTPLSKHAEIRGPGRRGIGAVESEARPRAANRYQAD